MSTHVRRRWFSFSLRALLVLVTALCCSLGWETSIVRERRAVLNEMQSNQAFQFTLADDWALRYPPGAPIEPTVAIPRVRRWLGDKAIQEILFTAHHQGYSETELERLKRIFPEAQVHELHAVPCHPGCFPAGTLIDTPQGPRPIETILAGELLIAILASGEKVTAVVQSVFVTQNRLWKIEAADGILLTTETQPLCLTLDKILPAGQLKPGSQILRCRDGVIRSVEVLDVSVTERSEKVFNLVLGDSELFVAGGFLARSKPPVAAPLAGTR